MSVTVKQMSLESGFERTHDCQRFLMSDGSWFHAAVADTSKDHHPKFVDVEMTMMSPRMDYHSPLLPLTEETG